MKIFSGFKRKVVVIVPTEEDAMVRALQKIQEEGQDLTTFSEVEFPELALDEAKKVIEKCKTDAKAVKVGLLKLKLEPDNQVNDKNNDRNDKETTETGQSNHSEGASNLGHSPPLPRNDPDPPRPESSLLEKRKKRSGVKKPETCHRCNSEEHLIKNCPVPKKKKRKKNKK
ncbi:hypothetical protein DAPPUDRAFT_309923 [Daphnia pulex]|uniref:CCHC-type domain-containing protein n=1 Tax=Daphnia pulex TaxID=6669 RepID=E9FR64_DAPPU|nr:hypothetical protein DAPPUDRAFT_309923 [Daphnia pulex]|eukprot:EFX90251.1 hypothetical protein DAPPUDRAFT_309923 [Daphnia pulex]